MFKDKLLNNEREKIMKKTEVKQLRRQEGKQLKECGKLNNFQLYTFNFQLKKAFTLAEVLITLAVIGVVAAMTLPTLIQKHQKMTWVNQLKANYSLLNQGFKTMMAEEGVERLEDTSVWQSLGGNCYYDDNPKTSNACKDFFQNLKKYFKITSITKDNNNQYTINLSNGAQISSYNFIKVPANESSLNTSIDYCKQVHDLGGHMCYEVGKFSLDINGKKGPNKYGRDIFAHFSISEKGLIVPFRSRDWCSTTTLLGGNSCALDKDCIRDCTTEGMDSPNLEDPYAAAARIIEIDNWQMKY